MKAILTKKGARRIMQQSHAGKEVEIINVVSRPWGARFADVIISGQVVARRVHLYTRDHGKDCGLIQL